MKYLIFCLVFLSGCDGKSWATVDNAELHQKAFIQCMERLPKGPEKSVYNDWDEVVSECRAYAREVSSQYIHATADEIDAMRRSQLNVK